MRQTGSNSDSRGGRVRTVRSSTRATKGIMPESYAGVIKEGPIRRLADRLIG